MSFMQSLKGLTAAILLLSPAICRAAEASIMASDTAMVSVPVVVKGAKEPGVVAVRDTVYVPVMPASLDSLTRMMEQRLKAIEERMYGIDTIRNVISSPLQERNEQHRAKRYAERESARADNWMRGRSHPFDRGIDQIVFVPKGQWLVGGNISFQDYTEDNYKFLIVEDINLDAYMFKVSPFIGYFVADNTALGARLVYSRTSADVGSVNLKINDDLSFGINDLTYIQHQYDVSLFLRNYINLGTQRRIGLFNETRLTYGGGQGKLVNSSKEEVKGTYQKIRSLQLGLAPGIVAFVTDNVGVEVSVGVLGLKYNTINQITNQVETGKHSRTSANFKIDLFSINLGMAFYINSMRGLNPVNYKFRKSARQATEDDFERAIRTNMEKQ